MSKPLSYIELSKSDFINNVSSFRKVLPKKAKILVVVKANAYGHGLKEVVSIVQKHVDGFQVDDIEELREVRAITKKSIFVFGYIAKKDLKQAVMLGATLSVYNKEILKELNHLGKEKNKKIIVHLKIDTFLGRQGILLDEVKQYGELINKLPFVKLEAIYSHFSNIEDAKNLIHAKKQFGQLLKAKEILQSIGFAKLTHHISSTSGFLVDMQSNWDSLFLRLGIGMYGYWPSEDLENKVYNKIKLRPTLRWISHLAQVKNIPASYPIGYGLTFVSKKPMKIGIVPQGYGDGYDRGFSNNSHVLIRGKKCPIIGRVAMNMFAVDLSNNKGAKSKDEVVLIGRQGRIEITAEFLADKIGTINYEILARISPKLPRVLKN